MHGLCILYMLLSDVPLSDQCRFKPAKTAAANPMRELGTSVVGGLSSMHLEGYKCLKMPSCLRLVPARMTPLPHLKTPTMANLP